jgi:hypothetical protein
MARTIPPKSSKANLSEMGSSGLRAFGNQISEEFLRQLSGIKGMKTYGEMRDNDPTIGAILFIIDKLLRNVKWTVTPADNSPAAASEALFLTQCKDDMEHSWEDLISEILSMLVYGFAPIEKVYKMRQGLATKDKKFRSKFTDGRVGWRKLPLRAQETIWQWHFDDSGDLVSIEQLPPLGTVVTIPIEKLMMFRTVSYKNNPQGRSILRNSYRPWHFKKRIEEVEGIGIERDLAGLPVAHVPANLLADTATPAEKATLAVIRQMVTNIRRDQQEGIVFPLVYDQDKNLMYKLELLNSGGSRQFDTSAIVDRYDKRIAMTVLADFIFLGQSKVGSFALSSDKTDMFSASLGAWLNDIAAKLNRDAVPELMTLNNVPPELWPSLTPGDIEKADVSKFAEAVSKLILCGALIPGPGLDEKSRTMLDIPADISGGNV